MQMRDVTQLLLILEHTIQDHRIKMKAQEGDWKKVDVNDGACGHKTSLTSSERSTVLHLVDKRKKGNEEGGKELGRESKQYYLRQDKR